MNVKVLVTGVGILTPLGDSPDRLWQALIKGQTAARAWPDLEAEGFRITTACRIDDSARPDPKRGRKLAVRAASMAVRHADLPLDGKIALFVGATMGESVAYEQAAEGKPLDLAQASIMAYPHAIQQALNIQGPQRAYATACAAGNYALGAGIAAIRSGKANAAIAGGVEPFSRIAMTGFSRSRAMAGDCCRPFDRDRSGMQLGEAAAFLVLESEARAYRRNVEPLACVESLGLSCDAYHPTAPLPDGQGMSRAMQQALYKAGIDATEVDWICAHGSGTQASDNAEAKAIERLFPHQPHVSGYKGAIGHSLGAATAVEAVITALALRHRVLPPTTNFRNADPEFTLNIVQQAETQPSLRWALNCGYAFGGLNSALLMGAV
ncbi:MAG: beta-ketoacyl-[acyl-carrier-protein] synthase family protein [Candidatus Thiodiazotropha sp. (ex Epidulcina cf. delphinae)]|nr:beta-ketoacyl-[acyl-carrier-protein] synthase family protein [Candidatus Thiodiazotropha sp. (ex Epidulcina cf. delphinae)]